MIVHDDSVASIVQGAKLDDLLPWACPHIFLVASERLLDEAAFVPVRHYMSGHTMAVDSLKREVYVN